MARLPIELTDIIIALLSSDRATLRACSLVCKDWLPPSRRHLFSTITLTIFPGRTRALIQLLAAPLSTIAKYVHTTFVIADALQPLSTIAEPLEKLVGVKTIVLHGRWRPVREWEVAPLSIWFAKITTLDIRPGLEVYDSPNEFSAFLCLFCSLRVLRLRACKSRGRGDDQHSLSLPSSLRAIHLSSDGPDFAWLIPFVKNSAVSELRLSQAGPVDLRWLQRLLHSCGSSIRLLDIHFPDHSTDVVRILHEHLNLSCLSNLQILRIGTLRHWFHSPDSGEYLSKLVSRITSEHMTKVTLQLQCFVSGVDDVLELVNWTRLARTLSHPRFARLRRVEIILGVLNSRWPEFEADEWVSRLRGEMDVLDSRGCLFVSVLYDYGQAR